MTVVKEVAKSHSPCGMIRTQGRTRVCCNVGEGSISQVVVGDLGFAIACAQSLSIHLGIDMSIGDKNARPAGVVKIEELHAPSQPILDRAQTRAVSHILEDIVATI